MKAIIAEGWTFRGPMTAIQKPVVIVVPEETVGKKPSPSLVDVPTLGIKVAGGSDVVIRGWCIYISTENGNEISRIAINVDPADLDEFLKANRCGAPDPYRRYVVDIQARRKSDGSAIDNYNVEVSGQ